MAVIEDEPLKTRTCVDEGKDGFEGILWCPDDQIGVYSANGSENAKFSNSLTEASGKATFSGIMAGDPAYAYYPYNSSNNGKTDISGNLPVIQEYSKTQGILSYDYKLGVPREGEDGAFVFDHLFALLRFTVNVKGTALVNDKLTSVTLTFPDGVTVNSGEFTVPVKGGDVKWTGTSSNNTLTLNWSDAPALNSYTTVKGYLACPPVSGLKGKDITVTLHTATYQVEFTTAFNIDAFQANYVYTFPLTLKTWEDKLGDKFVVEEKELPSITSLRFTASDNNGKILGKKLFYDLNKVAGTKKGGFLNLQTITYKGATNYTSDASNTTQTMSIDDNTNTINGCIPYLFDRNLVPSVGLTQGAKLQYSTDGNEYVDWDGESPIDFSSSTTLRVVKDNTMRDYAINITNTGLPVVVINQPDGDTEWDNIGERVWSKGSAFANPESGQSLITMGEITIYNADGSTDLQTAAAQTRLRGNTTLDYPKKPFAFKLDKKAKVLGMPEHKRWVLLANWKDKSLMRNHIDQGVGQVFSALLGEDGIPWNVRGQFVEVVYNGVHIGNYYLCEQVKIDGDRVDIQDEYKKENGAITKEQMANYGYLLEADDNFDEDAKFMTKHHLPFMFKDDVDDGGVILSTVKAKVQGIEDNLYQGYKGTASGFTAAYEDLDLPSVVDQLLIYEMSMNTEFRHPKSVYMYMDGLGKLKAGPVWDFDWLSFPTLGSGYTEESDRSFTASLMATPSMLDYGRQVSSSAPSSKDDDDRKDAPFMWYPMLIADPDFTEMAAERWDAVNEYVEAFAQEIYNTRDLIAVSWEYNNAMWPAYYGEGNYDRQYHITNGMCGDEKLKTFADVCQALHGAYMARVDGMNEFVLKQEWPVAEWKKKF